MKLSELIRPVIPGAGGIITINTEVAAKWADEVAALEARLEILEIALIGEDAQPLPEFQWYFDRFEDGEFEGRPVAKPRPIPGKPYSG